MRQAERLSKELASQTTSKLAEKLASRSEPKIA